MKRYIISFLMTIVLIAASTPHVLAEELNDAKRTDIQKLIEMTGAVAIGKQMGNAFVAQLSNQIKNQRPDLPPRFFDILQEEVNGVVEKNIPLLMAQIIPVYHKYFTHQDIKGMLQFYKTPLGQKTIRVLPQLMQESMYRGQQWGQAIGPEVGQRVLERFKAEGVDLQA